MLLEQLTQEAIKRNCLSSDTQTLSEADVFYLVRDMPYKRASTRDPETTIRQWRGTCSGKHYLLKALYEEMGYQSTLMACSHYIAEDIIQKLPEQVQIMFQGKRIPDIHNYLILEHPAGNMLIDATWPPEAEAYGLIINKDFVLGQDMFISGCPIEHFKVPDDVSPQDHKDCLLAKHFSEEELKIREAFFNLIT